MKNTALLLGLGLAGLLCLGLALGAFAVYNFVLGPTLSASGPITAVPVVVNTQPPRPTAAGAAATGGTAAPPATSSPAAANAPATSYTIFRLDTIRSQARFYIIPNVPQVANVSETILLEFDFTATAS
jgi:hypothetical protein